MNRVSSPVEFMHNDEEINAILFTHYEKGIERNNTIMFNYGQNKLHISLDEDDHYWNIAPLHCKVIDSIGSEGYEKYKGYLSDIKSIKRDNIIVNNKVYNYFSKCIIESPRYFVLGLKLEDDTTLDGTYNYMKTNDHGNKRTLFKNLQYQAESAFKNNKVEPAKDQLNKEKTLEYDEKLKWIKDINKSL